jgi:hypothetical protein
MAMAAALGGTPEQIPEIYRQKSFDTHAGELPAGVRVCVVSARKDKLVPPQLQMQIMQSLKEHSVNSKLIEIEGGHGVARPEIYLQAFDFAAGK